jgi:tetratricopeptide (TPR) repeat protein
MEFHMTNRLNQLLDQCDPRSPIERKLLCALYPKLTPPDREDLRAQYLIDGLPGAVTLPDLAFPKRKIAIYCDGPVHHGTREVFTRDRYQDRELQLQDWLVLRFSSQDIQQNVDNAVDTILRTLDRSNNTNPSYVPVQTDREITGKSIGLDRSNRADAYAWRGKAHYDKGDYDNGIAEFTKAILLKPNYADAYVSRANAYSLKGDYDQAIADYTKATKLDPVDTDAYAWRGRTYFLKGDYDQAIADLTILIQLMPNDATAYGMRSRAYYKKGDYARTYADRAKANKLRNAR